MTWIWIVPIVFGWYSVYTPSTRRSIREALRRASQDVVVSAGPHNVSEVPHTQRLSKAVKAPLAQREITAADSRTRFLIWTVAGDEEEQGPFFNYARCFSWMYVAKSVIDAHDAVLQPNNSFNSIPADRAPRADSERPLSPFGWNGWKEMQPAMNGMIKALFWASIFHAIPMTMATVTCYLTPTVGLGCCSFPVVLALSASFVAALLLIFSAVLSTFCMRYNRRPETRKSFSYLLSAVFAAVARALGKTIACLNAIGLFLRCLFSFAGVYNNCYCSSSRIGLRSSAYIVFLTEAEIRNKMLGIWAGCLAGTLFAIVSYTFYLVRSGGKLSKV